MGRPKPSFELLFTEHLDYVVASLRRLGVTDAAVDDLAQDVFVRVHEKLRDYDGRRPIRPWLFGFAFREASVWRRRASTRREQAQDALPATVATQTPEGELQADQTRRLVLRALDRLDEHKRAMLVLHDIDGQPVPEIARALEVPVNTAWSRLRAARKEFAVAFDSLEHPSVGEREESR